MSLLSTSGLSKEFGGLRAVHDVSFALEEGEVRALIGPNGAGKTTFVGMLCGRIEPSAGTVRFDGTDISRLPAHRRIRAGMAYTFQITSVFARLSCHENVALAVRRRKGNVAKDVPEALRRVGLADRAEQLAGDLSYGHQRLLEIAMGLAQKPRLLILDEPTQGLADSEIEDFVALIRELKAEATILLIEHNMAVVMEVADAITVLNFGEVLAEGAPAEIRANREVQAAYLGTG
ncbi:ABC transporter ATP-binding protein [Pseudoruegeria sp. HB172150]|uniref:ABC transporter ATP-binding protein n=1 Tax=Pseudoruegeria sp. HB172150 TaxID=2721164 RepID=UPI0015557522|nr:ABC transporter ATP-binding protein [Pseudoruegeria sp. HB172150]